MFDTHIQTTISVRGFVVFIEYFVTSEWAVEWWLNEGAYEASEQFVETQTALDLLESLLRTYEYEHISQKLIDEFESRQYAQEQAEAALLEQEDIPF